MTGHELRKSFLDFFASHDHLVLPGSSLVPADPTTLFTSAGMQQFVPAFRGQVARPAPRVATCQQCLRIDDLEKVGKTPAHETFFEMLGNFSFGDYFKREAIAWAWEYVTRHLQLPREKLWISVYPSDDEAFSAWRDDADIPEDRICRLEDNWWPSGGGLGPCGPDSEIFYDMGEEWGCGRPECGPGCECGRFPEIWNLVFQQFNREPSGDLPPLPTKNIDTGMGLERAAAVVQGKSSIFECDLFAPIMERIAGLAHAKPSQQTAEAARIIADHSRAIAFALADGVTPSNDGRGYVLRRLMRRAARFGRVLGIEPPFLHKVMPSVIEVMAEPYPELERRQEAISKFSQAEEERFNETLEQGSQRVEALIERAQSEGCTVLSGAEVFELYDTYGFPMEMTEEIARDRGLAVDHEGFAAAMEQQRTRARAAAEHAFAYNQADVYSGLSGVTTFVGYEQIESEARVLAIIKGGQRVESAKAGDEVEIILGRTPFYAEAGGQVGDTGTLKAEGLEVEVADCYYASEDVVAHRARIAEGTMKEGDQVTASVDAARRKALTRAHTATHLAHWALRQVLGPHALQAGSLVEPDRLRFDFSHFQAFTPEEIEQVERLVAQRILEAQPVQTLLTDVSTARDMGAIALFGEKYGAKERVVKTGDFSLELCGGTHAEGTGSIGLCKIVAESSIGAGLRRIEAVTGFLALQRVQERERLVHETARILKTTPEEIASRAQQLSAQVRDAEKRLSAAQSKDVDTRVRDLVAQAKPLEDFRFVAARVDGVAPDGLRRLADAVVQSLGSGVAVLAAVTDEKVAFASAVSKDLTKRGVHAGNLLQEVARITGGSGGGRADFAQAGGKQPERLPQALEAIPDIIRRALQGEKHSD